MKKMNKKPSYKKALKIGGIALVSASLVTAGAFAVGNHNLKQDNVQLSENLAKVNADYSTLSDNLNLATSTVEELKTTLANYGVELETFNEELLAKDAVIEDYKAVIADLESELDTAAEVPVIVEFMGYEFEQKIEAFNLSELNDNQFEKLGDYEVKFDGEDVDVKEFLTVKGDFNIEGDLSLDFAKNDIEYKLVFDTGLDFNEDSLKLNVLGTDMEITNISSGVMSVDSSTEYTLLKGAIAEGVTLDRIGESAVLVTFNDETQSIAIGDSYDFGDMEVEVKNIFFIDGADDNIAILKISEDLNDKIEVGDYVDEAELWRYTSIEDGKIVISLDDKVEKVSELIMPNDFAKISYSLSSEDYNDVEITKKNNLFTEIEANFENYDASTVEFENGAWIIELNNGTDKNVTGMSLDLKDSDYKIKFVNETLVEVAGIEVTPLNIAVSGDDDEVFTTSEGIIVDEHDNWNEDDDESVIISVPEEAIEATIKVE